MAFNAGAIIGTAKINDAKWKSGMKGLTKSVALFGTAVVAGAVVALTKATKKSDEWQRSLNNNSTLLDTNVVSMQKLTKEIISLDSSLGPTIELTDAMYQSFSAGAEDMNEALSITTDAAKFARAAVTNTATAVDVLTTATNAYGKENVSTEKASDIFFKTIEKGKINGEQLSSVIGQSIPLFASMNIPLEDLGAGLATMTKQGISASESTTSLNGLVNAFIKPSEAMKAALEEQGIASGSALLEAEGLTGALDFMESATGGNTEKIAELIPNIRGMKGVMALTGVGGEIFAESLTAMENSSGATAIAFEKQIVQTDVLKTTLEKSQLVIGNVSRSLIEDMAPGANSAAEGMLAFVQSASMGEIVGNIIGGVSAAFEGLKIFMEPIVDTIGPGIDKILGSVATVSEQLFGNVSEASGAFNVLSSVSQFLASALTVTGVVISNLIIDTGNLIVAIKESGGVIGSFFEFLTGKKKWDEVKEQADVAAEAFKTFGTGAKDSVVSMFDAIGDEMVTFSDKAGAQALEMETVVTTTFSSTKDGVLSNWDEMITGQKEAFDGLRADIKEGNEEIVENSEETGEAILDGTKSLTEQLLTNWDEYWASFELKANGAFHSLLAAYTSLSSGMQNIDRMLIENKEAEAEAEYVKRLSNLKYLLDSEQITEEEYAIKKLAIESEGKDKRNKLGLEAFKANKKNKIAQVWMDAASAISGWFASAPALGPVAGPVFAGAMSTASTGMALVQSGLIDQQKFVPERRFGGMASGPTRVNEAGGEIVNLPDGSLVIPNDISSQIAKDSGGQNIVNYFNFNNPIMNSKRDMDYMVREVSRSLGKQLRSAS